MKLNNQAAYNPHLDNLSNESDSDYTIHEPTQEAEPHEIKLQNKKNSRAVNNYKRQDNVCHHVTLACFILVCSLLGIGTVICIDEQIANVTHTNSLRYNTTLVEIDTKLTAIADKFDEFNAYLSNKMNDKFAENEVYIYELYKTMNEHNNNTNAKINRLIATIEDNAHESTENKINAAIKFTNFLNRFAVIENYILSEMNEMFVYEIYKITDEYDKNINKYFTKLAASFEDIQDAVMQIKEDIASLKNDIAQINENMTLIFKDTDNIKNNISTYTAEGIGFNFNISTSVDCGMNRNMAFTCTAANKNITQFAGAHCIYKNNACV